MTFASKLLLVSVAVAANLMGQTKNTQGLPPLIDREQLFGNPEITGPQLSPDGKYLAFIKPWKDTRNIWVKRTDEPFSAAHLLTTETKRPIPGYSWTWDAKQILFLKDNDGDENFNVYAVDPAAAPDAGAEAPKSRDLTNLKGVRVAMYSAPRSNPDVVYIGLNDRDKAWHDLYQLKISTGERTLLRKNTEKIAAWIFDEQGKLRLAMQTSPAGDTELLRVDPQGFTKVYSCSVFEACGPVRFHKDGKRLYMETNKGAGTDLVSLVLFDPETSKVEPVESDPLKRVDFGSARFSEATQELLMTSYTDDRTRRYFKDKALAADYEFLTKKLPGREVSLGSGTLDDSKMLIVANGDTEPGETYLFDRPSHQLTMQYRIREKIPRESLSVMKTIHYKSSDGLEIPAFLTLPKGMPGKGLPLLVIPHGGPWARDNWGYNPMAQFFANRGYAVLMPNFRGSTGYGKKFLNAGNGEWGRKMQDDITWGVKHLIAEGVADPKRIGIMGGSYGGYATLAGVAFTPDLYRAAVDIVGPSNLVTLLEAIPPYWEAGRKIMYARMGDMDTAEGKAWLKERSPLWAADKIKTPLLVVQGANDPRVNKREAEQIVIAVRDHGTPVEYILAPDEGHGFARPVNNMAMFMASEKFLAKYLDGRYQEGGTPEVITRLKELMVDPKSVTVSKLADAKAVGVPKPDRDLKPGTWKYDYKISAGGQNIALKLTTTVNSGGDHWVVRETMESPGGTGTDVVDLNMGSLTVRKREVQQGPMSVEMNVQGNQMTGKMIVNGQEKPISLDLGGPLFADAAGSLQVLGCLPLAEGYSATFRNFDIQKQKAKLMQIKVGKTEKITVQAGTFEAFPVDLTSAEGGPDKAKVWIDKDTRQAVKMEATLPQMGGASLAAELLP